MNTTLAACTGGLAAEFMVYFMVKKWDTAALVNGFLAGLVAITCPCYWVSDVGSCILGAVAGVLVILGMELLEHLRIDDPVGAFPVHGVCGSGDLSLGLFASGQYAAAGSSPTGVPGSSPSRPTPSRAFLRRRLGVLKAQCVGSFVVCAATFASAMVMFKALNAVRLLRVSKEGETRRPRPRPARSLGLSRVRDWDADRDARNQRQRHRQRGRRHRVRRSGSRVAPGGGGAPVRRRSCRAGADGEETSATVPPIPEKYPP